MNAPDKSITAENPLPWNQQLKRVGWVLIVFGAIDIAYMVYCITHQINYRSSFNIFAVVGGVYLVKGNLRAVNLIAWFAAFFLTGFAGLLVVLPIVEPFGLWGTKFHIEPVQATVGLVIGVLIFVLIAWVYRELASPQMKHALQKAGIKRR